MTNEKCCRNLLFSIVMAILISTKVHQLWILTKYSLPQSTPYELDIAKPKTPSFPFLPQLGRNESFGACLMVKGDNDLLTEWIPYHYTVLPLRHVVVVSDAGNHERPVEVLEKWTEANTDLEWWVVDYTVIEDAYSAFDEEYARRRYEQKAGRSSSSKRTATYNATHASPGKIGNGIDDDPELIKDLAHHHLVHKQKVMVRYCAKFMKERGVHWVSMFDTDEFLVVNRMETEEGRIPQAKNSTTTDSKTDAPDEKYGPRPFLPPMESNATVVDMISSLKDGGRPLRSCHTMPRVSFGANENFTCPGSVRIKDFARSNFRYERLSTLRFQKHAKTDDFSKNRWGKVMVDLSLLPEATLSKVPPNIHRPFHDECTRPFAFVEKAPFYLAHYSGGWERFEARGDRRRGYGGWKKLAAVGDSASCCREELYRWLPRFVETVGLDRARFLLGAAAAGQVSIAGA